MWKNRLIWIVWVLCAAALYLFANNAGTLIILLASLVVPIVFIALAAVSSGKVSIDFEMPDGCQKGVLINGSFILSNKSSFPLARVVCVIEGRNILTKEKETFVLKSSVIGKTSRKVNFSVKSVYCGAVRFRARDCFGSDLFGLVKLKIGTEKIKNLIVKPEIFETAICIAKDVGTVSDSDLYSMYRSGNDPSETYEIREYVPGDSIKNIHWKLSEKLDRLMVRELSLPVENEILLLIETSASKEYGTITPKQIDAMASVFFSVSSRLIKQGTVHTIGWQKSKAGLSVTYKISGVEDLIPVADRFLRNSVKKTDLTVSGCFKNSMCQCPFAHVIVVTPYLEPDLDSLSNNNRITQLLLSEKVETSGMQANGTYVIPFSENSYKEELLEMEI